MPGRHDAVDACAELVGVETDLAAQQQEFGRVPVALGFGREAEVADALGEVEQVGQLVRARAG
ncbi:hypothetical protein [Thauera humireducens]|uniref:hypothetical protein n=1 Tax=Thauera humireducens TaxID=1134435 RepID=UPI00312014C0